MSLFSTYKANGSLKFYKSDDDEQKLTISINIASNHELNSNLYDSIGEFLEKLLIGDYINEEDYIERKEIEREQKISLKLYEKQEKEEQKKRLKFAKEKEKERKASMKKTAKKASKPVTKSVY